MGLQKKTKKQLTHKKQCDIVISLSQDSKIIILYALLAQLAEHLTLNQGVQGSNPWRRTYIYIKRRYYFCNIFFFVFRFLYNINIFLNYILQLHISQRL